MALLQESIDHIPLETGFDDPIYESQIVFRKILKVMSEPGTIKKIKNKLSAPAPMMRATAAICLTLMDFQTKVWLDLPQDSEVSKYLKFHTGLKLVEHSSEADFVVFFTAPAELPPLNLGTDDNPETAATVIIQTQSLDDIGKLKLTGPGIKKSRFLNAENIPASLWDHRVKANSLFPKGIDIILTSDKKLSALPRTTKLKMLKTIKG
ncbi:MAG: phosphonate C-P lyase system protein PhnH [Rhodospirillaceae bacterium]|nr:phosphonate C-P lyase system protein PhnH [Rhodospirillaceae bacterium]